MKPLHHRIKECRDYADVELLYFSNMQKEKFRNWREKQSNFQQSPFKSPAMRTCRLSRI